MKKLLSLGAFFSTAAFAVTVANCPQNLSIKYSGLTVDSKAEDVFEELGGKDTLEEEEINAINDSFTKLSETNEVERLFSLTRARGGRCRYENKDAQDSEEKIEIYTTRGVDKLYMQTDLGPRGILLRTYANISSLSPTKISFKEGESASLAMAIPRYPYESYSAGGPLEFVGKASTISASIITPQ